MNDLWSSAVGRQTRDASAVAGRTYRLTVEGEIGRREGRAFDGMSLTRVDGTTVLLGPVRDQAELQGFLQRVSDLGLTLLSATAVDEPE
jgi:hypothetical protein